ncbi:MAG: alpha/beta hydrolase [Bacteroidetes bacterium]|nr:MAG: alpha/beta hydrolase [Bacteroidota bacterium]
MESKSLKLKVSPAIGSVSAECISTSKSKYIMTLAHGAGAGMNHSFLTRLSDLLSEEGIATLRFNFPFTENKKGRPDLPAVAHQTVEAAISKAKELFPSLPLFASGKSFGGRMTSQYLSSHPESPVKGIVFYGFPLHPPGKPSVERGEHLKAIKIPMLFLQGTRDQFAEWNLIESTSSSLDKATLVPIEGANHAYKAGKKDLLPELATATLKWISNL